VEKHRGRRSGERSRRGDRRTQEVMKQVILSLRGNDQMSQQKSLQHLLQAFYF
jgi:hypothetical protein